jgi:hypothetical protein
MGKITGITIDCNKLVIQKNMNLYSVRGYFSYRNRFKKDADFETNDFWADNDETAIKFIEKEYAKSSLKRFVGTLNKSIVKGKLVEVKRINIIRPSETTC